MTDFLKKIITVGTSRPKIPSLTIVNPEDKIQFVNLLEITPSAEFTRKGKIVIKINGAEVFDNSDDSDAFVNIASKPISTNNRELKRGSSGKIEFYVWNPTDTNSLSTNIAVRITENENDDTGSVFPISLDQVNKIVSSKVSLFERQIYHSDDSPFNTLLDLAGYSRFWLLMSASVIDDLILQNQIDTVLNTPSYIVGNFTSVDHDQEIGSTDFFVPTDFVDPSIFADIGSPEHAISRLEETETNEIVYDMLTDESHTLQFGFTTIPNATDGEKRVGQLNPLFSFTIQSWLRVKSFIQIEESDSASSGFSIVDAFGSEETTGTKTYPTITKRYVKIKIKNVVYSHLEMTTSAVDDATNEETFIALSDDADELMLADVVDGLKKGGTASISFKLKDSAGDWIEIIPSSEFGTVTEGNPIAKQVGDTLTKKYALPSTQSDFRAVLTVTGGGIQTAVTVEMVS